MFIRRYASTSASPYTSTVLLPKPSLPFSHKKPRAAELVYRQRTTEDLYRSQAVRPLPLFTLHDGPPYANGGLHMGHALNRMLKDFINRHKLLRGHAVNYIPGWDCHGLPIEQKAIKQKHTQMDPVQIRRIARQTALDAIELQKGQMQELGVMADWSNIYRTLDRDFEKRQLDLFRRLLKNGFIQHRLKPVYYSPSSRTALAESELVYKEITSRSIYVGFDAKWKGQDVKLVIWTTTPWSLPSNMAVAVDQDLEYVVVQTEHGLLIAVEGIFEGTIQERIKGDDLLGLSYTHLFGTGFVIHSPYVTAEGTGLVHTAPAHGHEDYEVMLVDKPKCPIDDDGNFVNVHPDLDGKYALESIDAIIRLLATSVLREKKYEHRYPCDWKTKKPVMIRATPQWFCDLSTIKPMAIQALEKVKFYPASARNRLEAFTSSRTEWCISRQRAWGVPIPIMYDGATPVLDDDIIDHVLSVLESKGTDFWWSGTDADFSLGRPLTRGRDTLDVWFDSGSSWTLIDHADVYLEGSDQHRGWFQSSLLTKVGSTMRPEAPYTTCITHGFINDEKGNKMSKSDGNGLSPVDMVEKYGADTCRLWAASVDYTQDVSVGVSALQNAEKVLKRWRNTMRFMSAYRAQGEPVSMLDEWILGETSRLQSQVLAYYDDFAFNRGVIAIQEFLPKLSTQYMECVKDDLYCSAADDAYRQGAVATLTKVFDTLLYLLAPITPHLAEELHEHNERSKSSTLSGESGESGEIEEIPRPVESVFLQPYTPLEYPTVDLSLLDLRAKLQGMDVTPSKEVAIDHRDIAQCLGVNLVSGLDAVGSGAEEISTPLGMLYAAPARGHKCPRCRRSCAAEQDCLCGRCAEVLGESPLGPEST